ncbi:hypothetical protein BC939DRAFT_434371 [Gamsiella multidivaricata]|uniref:uncharacterized protein n=1 Tax=Gamsiella multidivaricata TaxID=101098 RepID=UPI00221E7AF7|nr:uncharacterized protein BC939DRAFT_524403 [Gamsiella multidivaricata]XP_051417925.1 uncharacterized protein BC939DRAFT_434371 [Gamsiella multidivaricata]KAG0345731.1 hypothetical protein BGZ54_005449 [Gamsiella multidivaricata]KAI7832783.1 hypothetical protein BC939DRAFT_524403 [Gamsiella multidivaricata]KAI7832784.1 hypothetical protein BC939DRAFT_434371 [Gamsiella multidivaricata]
MKLTLVVIVSSVLVYVQAAACGGGTIKGQDVTDLFYALVRIGKDGTMNDNVLSNCRGNMCVSCSDERFTESGLRKVCPEAGVAVAPDVADGDPASCDYTDLKRVSMFKYYKQ